MKTKFLLLAVTAVAFIFSGCEKENIIDLTNIKAEVKLQCVDKEYSYSYSSGNGIVVEHIYIYKRIVIHISSLFNDCICGFVTVIRENEDSG